MSGSTVELNLATATDTDDNADYLTLSLANSLRTVDGLFNSVTGHTHGGAHQGGPVSPAAGSLPGSALANGTVTNAKLGSDTARANLLTNGGFEIWQRGNGPFAATSAYTADRWAIGLAGTDTLSVSKDTTNVDTAGGSIAAAACTFVLGSGAGSSNLTSFPKVTDGYPIANRTLSASVRVRTATANAVRIGLYTGSAFVYSTFHTGDGTWQTLTVTATMAASGPITQLSVFFAASCTAYIDNAMLVVGSQYADYAPLHPADDLARCLRYYEVVGGQNGSVPQMSLYGTAGAQVAVTSPFRAHKAVTPTATKVGSWLATNCNQPTFLPDTDNWLMYVAVTAAGMFLSQPNSTAVYATFEANP
jgi:hypothetical protein